MPKTFKIAVLQTKVFADKEKNLRQLEEILSSGRTQGADMVTLPEMFACPYETENFPIYAEPEGGPSWKALSDLAKKYGIYLAAGSLPELEKSGWKPLKSVSSLKSVSTLKTDQSKTDQTKADQTEDKAAGKRARIYNTAYVFGRDGAQIGKHRKAHLFDIDVEGGQCFKESDTLSPGGWIGCFDTEFCRMGLCICYDFRFPETARLMTQDGAKVILVPAAFNMTTGPAHWELMFRQRAVESQCYVVGTAPARDEGGSYVSWGHSIAVDPWGRVLMQMDEKEGVRIVEIDLTYVEKVRRELPLLKHRRTDLYELRRLS